MGEALVRIPLSPRSGCECGSVSVSVGGNFQCSMFNVQCSMFDFEKLEVYQVVKNQNVKALTYLTKATDLDFYIRDQWKRASLSILTNLAEGTGRMSTQDKKHYYTMARGSVFECTAILDLLHEMKLVEDTFYEDIYSGYEQCSKMLLAMYRSMDKQ
ncbi:MAG TPA: four helix bundle protein [Bacteroidales bacterium]|nr:four helix bundle protein [Bacteroidales bacterium]